jgi:PPK2 family polyphosphate:nucleotide phosphotransferase
MLKELRVADDRPAALKRRPTDDRLGLDKDDAKTTLPALHEKIAGLQDRLRASRSKGLLVVVQAMDAGGKDGVIRNLNTALTPGGTRVASFKVPAGRETEQDYLWRVHAECPRRGEIVFFNRSHYEDVVVVRVKELVEPDRWAKRYEHIRNFEQMLSDEGTEIVKIFLNISKEEQRLRQQDRIDDPIERWKFNAGDLADRERWDDFIAAYEDAINYTSTATAPWYVVPADRKWARDTAVARILLHHLERIDPQYPPAQDGIAGLKVK